MLTFFWGSETHLNLQPHLNQEILYQIRQELLKPEKS